MLKDIKKSIYRHPIDYNLISKAVSFYENAGYQYIESPWYVNDNVALATTDLGHLEKFDLGGEVLVGSGEQSLFQMIVNKQINPGKYVTVTPCFRYEVQTVWNHETFLKVELFVYNKHQTVMQPLLDAHKFLSSLIPLDVIETKEGYDLYSNGIELGSYGLRKYEGFSWIYGTGLAEPRTSTLIKNLI